MITDADIHPTAQAIREQACLDAFALLDQHAGRMTEQQARHLLHLLNLDVNEAGNTVSNRYGVGLIGHNANQLVAQLAAFNRWVHTLWSVPVEEAHTAAGQLWEDADLKCAGWIFPTAILHTRSPEQFPPWTRKMVQQLSAQTGQALKASQTGASYQQYCKAGISWMQAKNVPPILFDKVLSRTSTNVPSTRTTPEGALTIPVDAFAFLSGLQKNNNKEWFDQNRNRYHNALRDPLVNLVRRLGEAFIEPILNRDAPSDLVLETTADSRHTIARINRNSYGQGDPYWTYLWGAFYPKAALKKHGAAQLFVNLYPHGLEVGFYLGTSELIKQLAAALQEPALRHAAFQSLRSVLGTLSFDHGGDAPAPRKQTAVTTADDLAVWGGGDGNERTVRRCWAPGDPALLDGSLPQTIWEVFHAVYPLLVLSISKQPLPVLQAFLGESIEETDDVEDDTEDAPALPAYTAEDLASDGGFSVDDARDMVSSACYAVDDPDQKGQLILYGPPGTGKTWLARRIAWALLEEKAPPEDTRIRQVQFHPAYNYEDFVEGLRPSLSEGDGLRFRRADGVLRRIVRDALARPSERFVLLIDEINRADLPRVFGELMFLLSQRESSVLLPVSEERFRLPSNLTLIGTMNTADRSISHIDAALRRRFRFFHIRPSDDVLQQHIEDLEVDAAWGARLLALFRHVNTRLEAELGAGRTLGHAWFLRKTLDQRVLERLWSREILPLIEDYFDGEVEHVSTYTLSALLKAVDAT